MDVEKFIETTKPKGKRSKLEPFAAQIRQLKQTGYTNQQIQHWLSLNGVTVSLELVRRFAKRIMTERVEAQPSESLQGGNAVPAKKTTSLEDSRKVAEKYITTEAMNPILRKTLADQRKQQEKNDDSNSN